MFLDPRPGDLPFWSGDDFLLHVPRPLSEWCSSPPCHVLRRMITELPLALHDPSSAQEGRGCHREPASRTKNCVWLRSLPRNARHTLASVTMNDSDSPLKPATNSVDQDFDYVPILPEKAVRYRQTRHVSVMDVAVSSGARKPLRSCEGWTRHVHPSGRVYMRNDGLRVVMEGNRDLVCDMNGGSTRVAGLSRLAARHLWNLVHDAERNDYELFLRIEPPPNLTISYYFVDWANRSVFWAHKREAPQPIASLWHLDGVRELQFWTHVDYYPMHHVLPLDSREELDAILAYHTIDAKTFKETTSPWKSEETHLLAKSLPDAVHHSLPRRPSRRSSMESDITATHASSTPSVTAHEGASNGSVARLWRQIWLSRVQNFYGDSYARLARTERRNAYADAPEPPEWLRTLLSLLLFNRPPRFYNELRDVFVDEIIYQVHWKAFVADDVHPEWTQNGMMATVMLAANMAFLALSGVDDAAEGPLLASKVLSLSSTIFSTATLFTAMRLIAFHVKLKSATATDAMHYMHECSTKPLGLFGMAMLFSIPFVTFMWSMLTYIAAVLVFSFQHWSVNAGVPLITTTVVPVLGILVWMWWFFATSPFEGNEDNNVGSPPPAPPSVDASTPGGGSKFLRILRPLRRKSTGESTCVADEDPEKGVQKAGPYSMHR